jgi:peptidoglycan/LPS O-acetylase OafA/YrhL
LTARNPRFPLFDSLRAIAASSVLAFHVFFVLDGFDLGGVGRYAVQLNIGVAIFFLISGFLLYRPFARARHAGEEPPSLRAYATRRLFRIVPAYWVATAVIALWVGYPIVFDRPHVHFTFLHVYGSRDLGQGIGYMWTLAIEMTFYALLPAWAWLVRRLPAGSDRRFVLTEALPLAGMAAIGLWWNLTQIESEGGRVLFSPEVATLPRYLDHFALGMGLAVASVVLAGRERRPRAVGVVERRSWLPWLLAGGAFVLLCNLGAEPNSAGAEPARHELRGLVALGILLPAVFGDECGGIVRRLLAAPALLWVGLVSYSLYLWHPAVAFEVAETGLDERTGWVLPAIAIVAGSVLVAALSYAVVERPALRLGRRLAGASVSRRA